MVKIVENYGYAIVGENSGKVFKKFDYEDVKSEITSRLCFKRFKGQLITCALFNNSFYTEKEMSNFFINICKNRGIDKILPTNENYVVKFFHRTGKEENRLDLNRNLVSWIQEESGHLYEMPIIYNRELNEPVKDTSYNFPYDTSDLKEPFFGLIHLCYKLAVKIKMLEGKIISKEEAEAVGKSRLYKTYERALQLHESFKLNEVAFLSLAITDFLHDSDIDPEISRKLDIYKENLFDLNDKIYKIKNEDREENIEALKKEQSNFLKEYRRYIISLINNKTLDFSPLYKSNYDQTKPVFNNLFSYVNYFVMSGPCNYEDFDIEAYREADNYKKIEIAFRYFQKLKKRGTLNNVLINGKDISVDSDMYLTKIIDTIALLNNRNEQFTNGNDKQRTRQ